LPPKFKKKTIKCHISLTAQVIATNYCKYKGIFIATTNRIECQNYHNFTIARWPEKGNSQEFILEIQDGGRPTC